MDARSSPPGLPCLFPQISKFVGLPSALGSKVVPYNSGVLQPAMSNYAVSVGSLSFGRRWFTSPTGPRFLRLVLQITLDCLSRLASSGRSQLRDHLPRGFNINAKKFLVVRKAQLSNLVRMRCEVRPGGWDAFYPQLRALHGVPSDRNIR